MDETRNANVQLTANVQQYQTQMAASAKSTNVVTDSVNKLISSLDGITKRAGKKLLLFSAADTAAMTAYVAVAAKYEKQLTTLRAQTELTNRSLDIYKKGINQIARDLPVAGAQVAALVTQINQLGVTSERQALAMARTFSNLSAATGEDVGALTQGLIELSRQMGTLGNGASGINNFADSLTTVSNNAGVSATAVLQFSQSIAPMARAAGIGQKEVLGISTAFTKAGADGFAAANTFNSMISDITRQVISGSPELAKYAAAVGATTEQFAKMDSTERVVQIFEAVSKAGPDAVKLIDRLGYDGIRAAKSIQAVANEQGGLRKAIQESIGAYGSGSTQKGAEAAFNSLDAQMTRFRNNIEQIAASIGDGLLPVTTAFVAVLNSGLDVINKMAGPLLSVAGAIGGLLAPVTAALGGLMSAMGPLSTVMLAMTMFRLSPMRAGFQGLKEGMAASQAAKYGLPYAPTTSAGTLHAAGQLPIFRSAPFQAGQALGSRLPVGDGGPNPLGQAALRMGIKGSDLTRTWYLDPTKVMINNAGMADPMYRKSVTGDALDKAWNARGRIGTSVSAAIRDPYAYLMSRGGPNQVPYDWRKAQDEASARRENVIRSYKQGDDVSKTFRMADDEYAKTLAAHKDAAAALKDETAVRKTSIHSMGELRNSLAQTARSAVGMPFAYGRMGVGLAAQGVARVGAGGLGMLGSMVGASGPAAPIVGGALLVGGGLAYGLSQTHQGSNRAIINEDTQTNLGRVNAALGLAAKTLGDFTKTVDGTTKSTVKLTDAASGFALSMSEASLTSGKAYSDERVKGLGDIDSAVAFLKSMGELNGEQARALAEDLAKRFGAQTSRLITDTYQAQTKGVSPLAQTYGGIGSGLFSSAAAQSNAGVIGGLRNIGLSAFLGTDTNTTDAVQAAWLGAREQSALVGERYGAPAEAAKNAANSLALLDSAFNQGTSAGARTVQEQSVKQWEAMYGELGLSTGPGGIATSFLGNQMLQSKDDFAKYVLDPSNTAEGAVNFRASLTAAGLGASDLYGPQAKSIDELAIQAQRGNMSDYERRVRSTSLGEFARTNTGVLDVTEGRKVDDPRAVGAAVKSLYDELTNSGQSFDNVTAAANRLADAAGSASDPLYQLAMAAKDLAFTRGARQAQQEGGIVGSLNFRLNQNAQEIRNTTAGTDLTALEKQRDAIEAEGYDAAVAYESALYQFQKSTLRSREDFHRQMIYAEEDFGRSMARASETAAKSLFDPYHRMFSPGTISTDTMILNIKDRQQKIAAQMKNLRTLQSDYGLSQQAIDQFGLTDAANSFQVQSMVDEGGNGIGRLNKLAARGIPLASKYQAGQQSTRWGVEDFERQQNRGQDAFRRSMRRAVEDMNDYGREVYGSLEDVMVKIQRRMNKVMPGVESPFYKKLIQIADAIGAPGDRPKPASKSTGNRYGMSVQGLEGGAFAVPSSEVYDLEAGGTSWYQTGRGSKPYFSPNVSYKPGVGPAVMGDGAWGPNWDDATHASRSLPVAGKGTSVAVKGGSSVTTIDSSTNFNVGGMVVSADDPKALAAALAREAKKKAMVHPGLG